MEEHSFKIINLNHSNSGIYRTNYFEVTGTNVLQAANKFAELTGQSAAWCYRQPDFLLISNNGQEYYGFQLIQ